MCCVPSLEAIENVMHPSTLQKFHQKYAEGYNVQGDKLYAVWEQLKKLAKMVLQPMRRKPQLLDSRLPNPATDADREQEIH